MSEFLLDFEKPVVELEKKILSLKVSAEHSKIDFSSEIAELEEKKEKLKKRDIRFTYILAKGYACKTSQQTLYP